MGNCLGNEAPVEDHGLVKEVHRLQEQNRQLQNQVQDKDRAIATLQKGLHGGYAVAPPPALFVEVLWFPDQKMPCRFGDTCRKKGSCKYSHVPTSLTRFLTFISSSRLTLDICVFTITCDEISARIVDAHQRGVRVRIVTDDEMMTKQGSDVDTFRKAGIPVRHDNHSSYMHHKFCVVDGRWVLNGSFNWTRAAVLGNQENVVITDHPMLVQSFQQQFEKLWQQYCRNN